MKPIRRELVFTFTFLLGLVCFLPSSWAGTFTAFGPQNYLRETGSPIAVIQSFTVLNPNTTYTLEIHNGGLVDGEFEKVSSSIISLNGIQVVGPQDFNQNVAFVEKPVTLSATNELSVELRGKPGGGLPS